MKRRAERASERGRESAGEDDSKCKLYQNKKPHTKKGKENPKQCLIYWNVIGHLYGYKNKNQYLNSEFLFYIKLCYFLDSTEENGKNARKRS